MKCPVCNNPDSRVLDSRPVEDGASIKRRRECPSCGRRFTTYEFVDTLPITVIKRDGRREFFDRHKLAVGITRACQKRLDNAEEIALSIEQQLKNALVTEINSADLGEKVLDILRELDIVSYIRFASVYREFNDLDAFAEEIRLLNKKRKKTAAKGKE